MTMADIVNNIASTCPLAFGGSAGGMFAQSIAALVAAHCAFSANNDWPEDSAEEIIKRASGREALMFDYILVGAGTAGSLLASRLSEIYPSKQILLLDAGGDPGISSEVPFLIFENKEIDWSYDTEVQKSSCRGFVDDRCTWPSGRALGGSSSNNAMLYVRGHPNDYDAWESMGNSGWSYKDVLPFFDKVERFFNLSDLQPLNEDSKPFYDMMANAWNELGYRFNKRKDACIGTKVARTMIVHGRRLNSGKHTLNKIANNKNIKVMKNTKVRRVVIDIKNKMAKGVELEHSSGIRLIVEAKKEVILSAGAIGTPKILMLSGIGPKEHLSNLGIENFLDLPVGKNLQDQTLVLLFFQIGKDYSSPEENILSIFIKYMLTRNGPLSHVGVIDFMNFVHTQSISDQPDMQFHHSYYLKKTALLLPFLKAIRLKEDISKAIVELNENNNVIAIFPTLLHPKSKGEILLRNDDPDSPPVIKTNLFTNPEDLRVMVRAINIAKSLLKTDTFKKLGVKLPQLNMTYCSEYTFDSDEYWECYARTICPSIYHYVGTAKMGNDETSVVDSNLKVHGLKNLRIVDASVMPALTSSNTMSSTLMIAEKAADIIKRENDVEKNEL